MCHIAGCCHWANSTACHPRATYHTAGCCHLVNSLLRFQSHMPHCRVQSPGEINVMIVPHLQGVIIPSTILKNRFRRILFIFLIFSLQFGLWRAAVFVSSPIHKCLECSNVYAYSPVLGTNAFRIFCLLNFNPLMGSATSKNIKLVHWLLMGVLLYLVQRG